MKNNSDIKKIEAGVIQAYITDHFLTVLAIPINVNLKSKLNKNSKNTIKIINHEWVKTKLQFEKWEDVYSNNDINKSCESQLVIYSMTK